MISYYQSLLSYLVYHSSEIDTASLEVVRILAGTVAWIGGLILFMWSREKSKTVSKAK